VLAFIAAFLPTLLVEIVSHRCSMLRSSVPLIVSVSSAAACTGSTSAPAAKRFLRAERIAAKHQPRSPARDQALAAANAVADQALVEKKAQLQAALAA